MKLKNFFSAIALLVWGACQLNAAAPLKDYSHVRGVCHSGWMSDESTIRKE